FDQQLDVDRQATLRLQNRFNRLDVDKGLAFVIRRPARVEIVVADGGFKGRCQPLFKRVHWLDIKVAVDQYCRAVGSCMEPIGVDHGLGCGLDQFNIVQAEAAQVVDQPGCRCQYVDLVGGNCADAGDLEPGDQLVKLARRMLVQVVVKLSIHRSLLGKKCLGENMR